MKSDEKENRKRIVGIRFTAVEYEQIEQRSKSSTCRKISQHLRKVIFNKPVIATYCNKSLNDVMTELIQLKKKLNGMEIISTRP